MKICPNCYEENADDAVTCSDCGMGISKVAAADKQAMEQVTRKKELVERAKGLILTTGFVVENRPIKAYLGIITSEVVMGTGAIVEFLGGLSDMFGVRAGGFELKLEQAKDASLEKLKGKGVMLGADAVIGVDIDYMEIGTNMLMVVANGTAVKLTAP